VRLVESGGSIAAARQLNLAEQTLFHWVKGAASSRTVSVEPMEISRLRAELAQVKRKRDILGKATAYCVLRMPTWSFRGSHASQKMRVGPSEPAYRSWFQTTSSCIGQKPLW
jgi:transposase